LVEKLAFLSEPSVVTQVMGIFSQSQRRISPRLPNHGISPNDSARDSGWLTPPIKGHGTRDSLPCHSGKRP